MTETELTPEEAQAQIPIKEAELEELRRIAAYQPYPTTLFREAPAAAPRDAAPPPAVETLVVDSAEAAEAAHAEGWSATPPGTESEPAARRRAGRARGD